MHVSRETQQQVEARLRSVIVAARLEVFEHPYCFSEFPASEFPTDLIQRALAFVRDRDVWSALVPSHSSSDERFTVLFFHFAPDLDNSGFVGWLASHLKATVGTGVLVVCGQNSGSGGVYDYWGVPMSIGPAVLAEIQKLRHVAHF